MSVADDHEMGRVMTAAGVTQIATGSNPATQHGRKALGLAANFVFGMTLIGQLLFFAFILAFYYPATLSGQFENWNSKPLITGYEAGDFDGNLMFGAHVLLAALITGSGLIQMIPAIRNRWPAAHRWNGRIYLLTAMLLAFGGLWLVWVRGTYMNLAGAIGISLDALLILGCGMMAARHARARNFAIHRRWALRTFVVASAVWYMRVGYVAWGIASGGAGIGDRMNGPFDYFIAFANSLLPLAVLEIYLWAQDHGRSQIRYVMAGLLFVSGVIIAGGSVGAWLAMWSPYI
jgi:hypothetical protein